MLQEPMRCLLLILFTAPLMCLAQVNLDQEIRFMGTEDQRAIDGVASPTWPTSAITVETSLLGTAHWTEASLNGNNIGLTAAVPVETYRPGMLLRFICPADLNGAIQLRADGLADLPLLRSDGSPPIPGHLRAGAVV